MLLRKALIVSANALSLFRLVRQRCQNGFGSGSPYGRDAYSCCQSLGCETDQWQDAQSHRPPSLKHTWQRGEQSLVLTASESTSLHAGVLHAGQQ